MKQLSFVLSVLFAVVLHGGTLQAASYASALDTLNHYIVDGRQLEQFDGSQLEGKKVISYKISTYSSPSRGIIRLHEIQTEGVTVRGTAEPVYVVDGKLVAKKQFESLSPSRIKSITVNKNVSREEYGQYPGWENGVILVETKPAGKDAQVNIGYGEADSRGLSFSISSVKPEEKGFVTNMYDYLRGKVAGVQVNPDNSIYIRGINSKESSKAPLILVDGLEIEDLSILNPQDVYSVDVLKDASTAIYGLRGANGVILITTKRGK